MGGPTTLSKASPSKTWGDPGDGIHPAVPVNASGGPLKASLPAHSVTACAFSISFLLHLERVVACRYFQSTSPTSEALACRGMGGDRSQHSPLPVVAPTLILRDRKDFHNQA